MAVFSRQSLAALNTCDQRLVMLAMKAIEGPIDFAIVSGRRTPEQQAALVARGRSKTMDSKHVRTPSLAFDFAPYIKTIGLLTGAPEQIDILCKRFKIEPHEAEDFVREQYTLVAGILLGIGLSMKLNLRWGGDWDNDGNTLNNRFDDLGHIELVE